jgi:hypothetical protein
MNRLQQRSRCNAQWPRHSQRVMQVSVAALLACLSLCAAGAKQPDQPAHRAQDPAPEAEFPSPIVIQGEELRPDDSMRRFRDTLERSAGPSERRLADGTVELITRFGRFCVKPLPSHLQPGIGGDLTLAARCASL